MPGDHLSDHEYDGIREYDNPTPGWWHAIFLVSVLFSLFYFAYYEGNPNAPTPASRWAKKQTVEYKKIFGSLGELTPDDATILRLTKDATMMNVAQGTFASNCAQCHAKDGGGLTGVNLTDDSHKNAKVPTDLFHVISNGAGNGGMPAWKNNFSQNERILLAAYVASLRGTKPATPKAPEGQAIPPWSAQAPGAGAGSAKAP